MGTASITPTRDEHGAPPRLAMAAAAAAAVLAASVAVGIILKVGTAEGLVTGPRQLPIVGVDGDVSPHACGGDPHLEMLVVAAGGWTVCLPDPDGLPRGGLALLDPAGEEAMLMRWSIRPGEPPIAETLGVMPSTEGDVLALVYRSRSPDAIVVAIAGLDGFIRRPTVIGGSEVGLLGMSWVLDGGDPLEVALGTGQEVRIVRVPDSGEVTRSGIARETLCRDLEGCFIAGAYWQSDGWRFVLGDRFESGEWLPVFIATTEGERNPLPPARERGRDELDLSRAGVLLRSWPARVGHVLGEDGFRPPEPHPLELFDAYPEAGQYERLGSHLRLRLRYHDSLMRHPIAGGQLAVETVYTEGDNIVSVGRDEATTHFVARDPLASLEWDGGLLRRREGGYYLVTPRGSYVTLSDEGVRLDPLSPFEQIWIARPNVRFAFWFLIAGYPFCLLIGLIAARRAARAYAERRGGRPRPALPAAVIVGSLLFLAIAFIGPIRVLLAYVQ